MFLWLLVSSFNWLSFALFRHVWLFSFLFYFFVSVFVCPFETAAASPCSTFFSNFVLFTMPTLFMFFLSCSRLFFLASFLLDCLCHSFVKDKHECNKLNATLKWISISRKWVAQHTIKREFSDFYFDAVAAAAALFKVVHNGVIFNVGNAKHEWAAQWTNVPMESAAHGWITAKHI